MTSTIAKHAAQTRPRRAPVPFARKLLRCILLLLILIALSQVLLVLILLTNTRRGDVPAAAALVKKALDAGGMARVEFYAEDGLLLRGDLLGDPASRPVVVFGHGFRDRRRAGDPLAHPLLELGYAVLLFDFRGSGASHGRFSGAGAIESPDVIAALRYLEGARNVPRSRIAYVGFSMGASTALLCAGALSDLAAVVLIAPYARLEGALEARTRRFAGLALRPIFSPALSLYERLLHVDLRSIEPVRSSALLAPAPLLLLGGQEDWRSPPADLQAILQQAGQPKELRLLPGHDHLDLRALGPAVLDQVLPFLTRHLPP